MKEKAPKIGDVVQIKVDGSLSYGVLLAQDQDLPGRRTFRVLSNESGMHDVHESAIRVLDSVDDALMFDFAAALRTLYADCHNMAGLLDAFNNGQMDDDERLTADEFVKTYGEL